MATSRHEIKFQKKNKINLNYKSASYAKTIQWEKEQFFSINDSGTTRYPHTKERVITFLIIHTKINSKMAKDLNLRANWRTSHLEDDPNTWEYAFQCGRSGTSTWFLASGCPISDYYGHWAREPVDGWSFSLFSLFSSPSLFLSLSNK